MLLEWGMGAPYCLSGSGFINCQLIDVGGMLTCWGYVCIQVIVYYSVNILIVFLIHNGYNDPHHFI
jgi:hypothetical protein